MECTVEVSIVDNIGPIAVAKQNVVLKLENGFATLTPEMVDNGSHDGCTEVSFTLSKTLFTVEDLGEQLLQLRHEYPEELASAVA